MLRATTGRVEGLTAISVVGLVAVALVMAAIRLGLTTPKDIRISEMMVPTNPK